jgi:ribosomal protein S18 acetylase RimI-like enzyme
MPSQTSVTINVVEKKHLEDVIRIRADFLNSKHCCCILPLGVDSDSELRKLYAKNPEMMQVAAVASVPDKGVVGFIQVIFEGMPCEVHTAKYGEAYISELCVDAEARGMGVGTALMNWAEDLAKQRNSTYMSLSVLYGNPAIGLYKRKGYVAKKQSIFDLVGNFAAMCCFIGPLICPSGSPSYCNYGMVVYMEKQLE